MVPKTPKLDVNNYFQIEVNPKNKIGPISQLRFQTIQKQHLKRLKNGSKVFKCSRG